MFKKILFFCLIFLFISCGGEKYSVDFVFLWKDKNLKHFLKIEHLGIEKKAEEFWANSGEISSFVSDQNKGISFEIKLGKEPYFLFYPLTKLSKDESVTYKISIFKKDKLKKIHKFNLKYEIPPAPERILVDLKEFQGKKVKIELNGFIDKKGNKKIVWGSPFIIQKAKNKAIKNKKLNFLIISIDTLRADALGVYGKKPSISPNIDDFSQKADVFLNCYSTSNKTNPSFCSILSGLYSKNHGIYTLVEPLSHNVLTLPEIFKKYDYETIAIVSAFHLHSGANLCQRFSKYSVSAEIFSTEEAVFETIHYLKQIKNPFFLWLHIFDPHTPHTAPEPFFSGYYAYEKFNYFPFNFFKKQRESGHLEYIDKSLLANPEMYYDEVAYMDFSLGFLFKFLESNGFYKDTVVAIISDHGENLNEHGNISDHGGLWETTTHIPLMLKIPEKKKYQKFEHFVQSIDLFPTILRIFNFYNYENNGIDLYPENLYKTRNFVFAEAKEENEVMLRSDKYLFKIKKENGIITPFLFETKKDPKEIFDISKQEKEIVKNYIEILNLFLKDKIVSKNYNNISEEDIKKLKSLGYLY